ncbi:uncharacterized protein LOC128183943 [Crassostrea angulata]|uniref:uncharacterized protein LOC128183943 n=1 Tax=Magallana angulata TaxID=2784310 RepID=UPI0022B08C0B|nr:uncharacterized protein LOC128183943 [Crassostrea angulata]
MATRKTEENYIHQCQEKLPSFMHMEHSYTSTCNSRKRCKGTLKGKTYGQASKKAPVVLEEIHNHFHPCQEKMPSFMHVEHSYTSSNSRKRCRGTPTGKTPVQASKKAPIVG